MLKIEDKKLLKENWLTYLCAPNSKTIMKQMQYVNNTHNKGKTSMFNVRLLTIVGSIFGLGFALAIIADGGNKEKAAKAKQSAYEKWSQTNLFINSLERYNKTYHGLKRQSDKDALALAYVKMLTADLFLLPSKPAEQVSINALLPADKEGGSLSLEYRPYILQQIHIGADNGLYNAFKHLINQANNRPYEPPHYSQDIRQLLEYIVSGDVTPLI